MITYQLSPRRRTDSRVQVIRVEERIGRLTTEAPVTFPLIGQWMRLPNAKMVVYWLNNMSTNMSTNMPEA